MKRTIGLLFALAGITGCADPFDRRILRGTYTTAEETLEGEGVMTRHGESYVFNVGMRRVCNVRLDGMRAVSDGLEFSRVINDCSTCALVASTARLRESNGNVELSATVVERCENGTQERAYLYLSQN